MARETNGQVGGDHYKKCGIEPVEYIHANRLDFNEGSIVKYISRHRNKNGAEDITLITADVGIYEETEKVVNKLKLMPPNTKSTILVESLTW